MQLLPTLPAIHLIHFALPRTRLSLKNRSFTDSELDDVIHATRYIAIMHWQSREYIAAIIILPNLIGCLRFIINFWMV